MKIIPKLQSGGEFKSLFPTYREMITQDTQPEKTTKAGRTTQAARSSSDEDDSKGKLTEKDLFNMLKDIDGLPNEMYSIIADLNDALDIKKILGESQFDIYSTYLQGLYRIRTAINNKKQYDEARANSITAGSMSEPAITSDGKVLVQKDDGNIQQVSLKEYINDRDSYGQALTVSNLLNLRAYDPKFANSYSAIDIINNSIGYLSFQKLIKEAVTTLGSTQIGRYGVSNNEELASKGLALLETLKEQDQIQPGSSITSDELYKYKIIDKNQKNQIDALTSYISALLPENAKTWAALKLNTSNKEKATANLITTYLSSRENITNEVLTQPMFKSGESAAGSATGSKSGSRSSTDEPDMTFLTALQNGYAENQERRKYNLGGNGSFYVTGSSYGAFLNQKGEVISNATLQDLLTQTGLAGLTNVNSITFGDNLIKANQLPLVAIENTGGVRAILPCKRNGTQVTPNFELMGMYDKLVQEVNNELGSTATFEQREAAIQKKIQQHPELKELLDVTGKLDYNKFCAFVIVDGLASDLNFSFKSGDGRDISDNPNPLIQATDDEADQNYFNTVTQQTLNDGIFKDVFGSGINKDKLYKSTIFIPINTNNRLTGVLFSGQTPKDSTALGLEQEYQTSLSAQNLNSSNPLLLWQ